MTATTRPNLDSNRPVDLTSAAFHDQKYAWYRWMLEEAPVCTARISVLKVNLVSRYEDCRSILSDPRFVRSRARARGKGGASPFPFPLPGSVMALAMSMIVEDDPAHRRLRNLVSKAFTARAVARLSDRVENLTHELLDTLDRSGPIDLLEEYARPIPARVISEMMGVDKDDADDLHHSMSVLTRGLSGLGILRTVFWDLRRTTAFVRKLIAKKRVEPGDDMLSDLIAAEEEGDRLSEDELLAMVFLLIIAGFETTMHLVGNGTKVLIEHEGQRDRLRSDPQLWDSAVEELVRYRGPIHATKPIYAVEDVVLHGETIARGTPTFPMLGAANMDPRVFDDPETLDVGRSPNHHLGFGFGDHFCLGRQLALMEARIALKNLFERKPDLRFGVESSALEISHLPGWHRYKELPVILD